jgi:hypothetical protein
LLPNIIVPAEGWVKNWECVLWQIPLKANGMFGRHGQTVLWWKPNRHKLIQINPIKINPPTHPNPFAMVLWFNLQSKLSKQSNRNSTFNSKSKFKPSQTKNNAFFNLWTLTMVMTNVIQFRMIFFLLYIML